MSAIQHPGGSGRQDRFFGLVSKVAAVLLVIQPILPMQTLAPQAQAAAVLLEVTPSNMQGWEIFNFDNADDSDDSTATDSGTESSFVTGPSTPPSGSGSLRQQVGTDGDDGTRIRTSNFNGTELSSIVGIGYSTYVSSFGSGGQAPYLQLRVDKDDNGTTDDVLFFEPVYQTGGYGQLAYATTPVADQCTDPNCVVLNEWQDWNAYTGGWWSNTDSAGGPPLTTLNDYVAEYPGAKLATDAASVRITSGFGAAAWADFDGNADKFSISIAPTQPVELEEAAAVIIDTPSLTVYNFEPDQTVEEDPKLALTKSATFNTVTGEITFTLNWEVTGSGSVTDLEITDDVPTGTTFVSADNSGTEAAGTVTWNLGDKNGGDSGMVSFVVTLDSALALDVWADSVESFDQGTRKNGTPVPADRSDPNDALGAPETAGAPFEPSVPSSYFSLGFTLGLDGGTITLKFDEAISNGTGDDLKVFEVTSGPPYPDETIRVEASLNGLAWTTLGMGTKDASFDLGALPFAKYIRITDVSNKALFEDTADGYDVDGIQALHLIPDLCKVPNTASASATLDEEELTVDASYDLIINQATCEKPDLDVEKEVVDNEDGTLTYTINWELTGSGPVEDVTLVDDLPVGAQFVSASNSGVHDGGTPGTVTWNLGDLVAPASGSVTLVVDAYFGVYFDAVLDYEPGNSTPGTIRMLDATDDSPVLPDLEDASFPVLNVKDLEAKDGAFINTIVNDDFGSGVENVTVDDEAQTFVAIGDGGSIKIGPSDGSSFIFNGAGDDMTLFETPNPFAKDPACIAVVAMDDTVYPTASSDACEGNNAYKFQGTGDALATGVPINLDALGVPANTKVKAVILYDIEDNHILGTTGSSGYDLDAVLGNKSTPCSITNEVTLTGDSDYADLSDSDSVTTVLNPTECKPEVEIEKAGDLDDETGEITYTITYHVNGTGTATDVVVEDLLPDNVVFVSASDSGVYDAVDHKVVWNLGDIVAPFTDTLTVTVDTFFDVYYDAVLDYTPGDSDPGTIRVLDATTDSPVPPDLEGASFPVLNVKDLKAKDGTFVNTTFNGDFGSGDEDMTVDDEAQTFVALGDGGTIKIGPSDGSSYIFNGPGFDLTLFETPNISGKDPACIAVVALDNTVYPTASSDACEGKNAYKFQDQGEAPAAGIPLNLDALGVPSNTKVKAVIFYDLDDGHIMGTTGSAGYDLDALSGQAQGCSWKNVARIYMGNDRPVSVTNDLEKENCEDDECTENCGPGGSNLGSISGVVFNDVNSNAVKDEGESQLSGWTVFLDSDDDGTLDGGEMSAVTASPYLFSNLADGTYHVRQILQTGWTQTLPADKYVVIIAGGNDVTDRDFGNHQNTSGGCVTNCGSTGGGGGGGGPTPGNPTPPPPPPPTGDTGSILGENTTNPTPTTPQVLGATTELPRTGSSLWITLFTLLALAVVVRKLKLKQV